MAKVEERIWADIDGLASEQIIYNGLFFLDDKNGEERWWLRQSAGAPETEVYAKLKTDM